ncbi:quinone oxidoreductase-like isoform X2 [Oratosquilla oratoria]
MISGSRMSSRAMRAVYVRKFGAVDQMKVEENVAVPKLEDKQILIKIYMSGVNPVDTYIREGDFGWSSKPYVPGIDGSGVVEAVGSEVTQFKVLVKLYASGVNPVDTYIRSGQYGKLPTIPYVPGKDGAGLVDAVGSGATRFKVGDRVFCSQTVRYGTLAEFTAMDEDHVFPLADSLDFAQGAAIGIPYFTAYKALLLKGRAKKGDRVLVHGASGSVGLAAVQLAKAYGMTVVGTAGTAEGLELVSSQGADAVYNHRDSSYMDKLKKNPETKFDVILEMLSNVNLGHDLELMKPKGRTIIIGCRGPVTINPRDMMGPETEVIGCALFSSTPEEWNLIGERVAEGISSGWVKPVINKIYDLHKAGEAHHDVIHSTGAKGKLVVRVQE